MRKWKILLGVLALAGLAVAFLARDQMNRNIIQLKNGRIIPVDRVWESGADLFYENEKEIHFISRADIQSIEKQSLATWLRTAGDQVTSLAGRSANSLNAMAQQGLALARPHHSAHWYWIGALVLPIGLVPTVRWVRARRR